METPQVVHMGRNKTCCWGKCFINSGPGRCFLTILMINVPVVATLYLSFDEIWVQGFPDEESFIWYSIVIALVYLAAASNFNMMACAMTDPGIVPARRWENYVAAKYDEPKDKLDYYTQFWQVNQRSSSHLFRFTFCKTCQIFQPPRCNHCPLCNTCVLELDHHCLWLGTCLGIRNYSSYYWFLVHLVLLCVYQLVFIPVYMWRVTHSREVNEDEESAILTWPEWIIMPLLCIYIVAIGSWVVKLCYFHQCYVLTSGETAYEMIKQHYIGFERSPHKRGSSCYNFCLLACCRRRVIDSRLDLNLQVANEQKQLSQSQVHKLREVGIIDEVVEGHGFFQDEQHLVLQSPFYHEDMNDCPEWQLTFQSRMKAQGNLRFFRRIQRQIQIVQEHQQQNYNQQQHYQNYSSAQHSAQKMLQPERFGNGNFYEVPLEPGQIGIELEQMHHNENTNLDNDPFAVQ